MPSFFLFAASFLAISCATPLLCPAQLPLGWSRAMQEGPEYYGDNLNLGEANGLVGSFNLRRIGYDKGIGVMTRIEHALRGDSRANCCVFGPPISEEGQTKWRGAACEVAHRRLPSVEIIEASKWNRRWAESYSGRCIDSTFQITVAMDRTGRLVSATIEGVNARTVDTEEEARRLPNPQVSRATGTFVSPGILRVRGATMFGPVGLQECANLRIMSNGDLEAFFCSKTNQPYDGNHVYSIHDTRRPMCPTTVSMLNDRLGH